MLDLLEKKISFCPSRAAAVIWNSVYCAYHSIVWYGASFERL